MNYELGVRSYGLVFCDPGAMPRAERFCPCRAVHIVVNYVMIAVANRGIKGVARSAAHQTLGYRPATVCARGAF